MAAPNTGTDLALTDAFEATFPLATGNTNLVNAVFRRLTTNGEAGIEIYAGKCLDVRDLFLARLDASRLPGIARQVEKVCQYDERIDSAVCKASFNFSKKTLVLEVNLTPADGSTPFTLILSVDSVTVEILANG